MRTTFAIDELSYASPFRHWPPLGKFLLAVALLIASLVSSSVLVPLIVFAIGSSLLFYSTHLRFPRVIALALLDALLIFVIGTVIIAFVTGGKVIWTSDLGFVRLSLSREGVDLGMLVFFKALAGVSVMLFFATSTPIPHFAAALKQMKIPKDITELVILVYRYSFLLFEQLDTMYTAAQCRVGFHGIRNKFRTTGKLSVGLFIRSLEVADRSQIALQCRNFSGDFPTFRTPERMTLAWVIVPIAALTALLLVNQFLTLRFSAGWW